MLSILLWVFLSFLRRIFSSSCNSSCDSIWFHCSKSIPFKDVVSASALSLWAVVFWAAVGDGSQWMESFAWLSFSFSFFGRRLWMAQGPGSQSLRAVWLPFIAVEFMVVRAPPFRGSSQFESAPFPTDSVLKGGRAAAASDGSSSGPILPFPLFL
ncbi:hypothetical protein V6N13_040412 [Hibiscus sabdariffa]|uniref:Secreted protein n=1 Tax=Hibiscus sabdariffa TaxID=183260 RepID=A0ABR2R8E1_9ROSI